MSIRVMRSTKNMDDEDDESRIRVNCGRCGEALIMRILDIKDSRTIDCPQCRTALSTGHSSRVNRADR